MYSYQHRYHAGGFSDIHKHLTLIALLSHLHKKTTPFCVLDGYAGEGIYDLDSKESKKIGEYKKGILPLLDAKQPPPLVQNFLNLFKECNAGSEYRYYPGSPAIIAHYLRPTDRAIFIEGHESAFTELSHQFRANPQTHLHRRDAIEGIKGLLPFKEKRGLVFIDPSYEVKTEYQQIEALIVECAELFPQATYAIWYPILPENYHTVLLNKILRSTLQKVWFSEWFPDPKATKGLLGSGMLIVNLPWQVDTLLNETFKWLNRNVFLQGKWRS